MSRPRYLHDVDAVNEYGGSSWRKFLARLQGEISKRGTIDVLRHGISHGCIDPRPARRRDANFAEESKWRE